MNTCSIPAPAVLRPLAGALSLALLPMAPVLADDARQEEIIVTATRTAQPLSEALSSVSLVSRKDLDVLQPLDLVDVFDKVPGIDITQSGGPGSTASLFIRGNASDHTLFLVDGQRVGSATLGSTSFQYINPDQIERIEVVRGAHSSLYGSDAIGGVVQIFTRDGSGTPGSYVSGSGGSHNAYQFAAGTSGNSGAWRYGANLSYLETDGIDNLVDDSGFNADDDGYRNQSMNASLGYTFDSGADLALRYLAIDTRNEYDNAYGPDEQPYSDGWTQNLNLRGRLPVTDFWLSTLSLGVSTDDTDNYDDVTGANTGHFRTTRDQLFWQNDFTVAKDSILTVAYEYYDDAVDASSAYERDGQAVSSRSNEAWIGEVQLGFSLLDVVLGARADDNEEFGRETTGSIALGLDVGQQHRIIASWAEGFKAPTFNDLYWPASAYTAGNPDLVPEASDNRELGIRGDYSQWHWSLTWFDNTVENLINWAPGADFVYRPYNVADASIQGAEFMSGASLGEWQLEASYTYVEARDDSTDHLLPNRARSNFVLNIDRPFGPWQFGLSLKAQDRRYTNADNSASLPGYATLGVRAQYTLWQGLVARLRVDNLLDKNYQLDEGYNQDGLNVQLGLSYTL
ncbi:TonB-dependent receptor domain-containing protein [Parahaliea mediterranea]|uniref:TonB-dependent receptor domain-containing protein n=1 Tax=Parahaliea mediterranea TaxID=651086 RepID=UPI000E2EE786|nr:TonB-dependent receptor [Parahaliea mediterranea]